MVARGEEMGLAIKYVSSLHRERLAFSGALSVELERLAKQNEGQHHFLR
jgi:hypothetical protein